EVRISTRNALGGVPIGELKDRIENEFRALDERERKTRTALAKLEVDFLRRFMELGK
ncbi:MAG: F0F1 ATP synthase subunit epsilon, partial [Nitrospinaceae bacterium]|nr:F0F1 ATP synthase subunit epsilon [Nitrospinaceae bacterium]NIR53947.1 F0F1 ATP synthase subunit epsilon [Nitrospinaceae bacterium]NIS84365.1 F0F1 ATP synthase subunit epsilon [Nitrospinaceae bacterium]NIT81167.1 F0F1 ATP synthase subunit epsilon [Nitrospinaceae bacterium]NIU43450.1 F0F1 ATP synthase subunit epsilon [Nitrospinaceae bacterium]